jgi:hypothetical protein
MNERDFPEIKEIMEEWIKEVELLEPLESNGNVLNNSLNEKRIELEYKYKKRIEETLKEHSSNVPTPKS